MEEQLNFAPLLLIVVLAFLAPLLLGRLRWLPIVVGEILAGVIIGHSGFNLVGESEILEIFSNIGLSFLMFLAGMEIDFDRLFPTQPQLQADSAKSSSSKKEPNVLLLSLLVYIITLALALPGGLLLNNLGMPGNTWLLAFVLSATSLGVLLPILKQRQMNHTTTGQAIFLSALLADFLTVTLLTVYLIIRRQGLDLEVFSIGLLFLAFFLSYRLLNRFVALRTVRVLVEELSQVTVQIKVRGAIAILMIFVVLASALGLELILGAFMAGMIISLIRAPEDIDLVHKLEAFGFGFFIPVFFIMVGVNLELGALLSNPSSLIAIPALLLFSVLIKLLPMLIFRKHLSWREMLASGLLLNTHLSIEIAIAVIGERLGLLDATSSTVLILFAILTVLIMPILFNTILPHVETKSNRWIVIYSAHDLGLQVARVLENHGEQVRFLEPDLEQLGSARKAGFEVIHTPTLGECLEVAAKDQVQALLVLNMDDDHNLEVCRAAQCQGISTIVSLVNNPSRLDEYRSLEVKPFAPGLYQPALLALLVRSPDIFDIITNATDDQDVRQVLITNPVMHERRLYSLGLPINMLILAINRQGEMMIPHGSTSLHVGDSLTILGNIDDLNEASLLLER